MVRFQGQTELCYIHWTSGYEEWKVGWDVPPQSSSSGREVVTLEKVIKVVLPENIFKGNQKHISNLAIGNLEIILKKDENYFKTSNLSIKVVSEFDNSSKYRPFSSEVKSNA